VFGTSVGYHDAGSQSTWVVFGNGGAAREEELLEPELVCSKPLGPMLEIQHNEKRKSIVPTLTGEE
jgi:hypothetical protein